MSVSRSRAPRGAGRASRRPGRQSRCRRGIEGDGRRHSELAHDVRVGRQFRPRTVEQRQWRSGPGPTSATTCGRSTSRSRRRARPGSPSRRRSPAGRPSRARSSRTSRRPTTRGRNSWRSGSRRGASSKARRRTTRPSKSQSMGGKKYNVVTWMTTQKAPSGIPYKVVGYINDQNLVEKVETWLENPIFGDMLVEGALHRVPRRQRPEVPRHDRAEARRRGDVRSPDSGRQRESQEHRAAGDASRRRSARRPAAGSSRGSRGADIGEARRRRLSHQRRVQRHGDRVQGSHRAVRGRTADRGAVDGDHRGSEEADSEQADPVLDPDPPSLRPFERSPRRRRGGRHHHHARGQQAVPREGA